MDPKEVIIWGIVACVGLLAVSVFSDVILRVLERRDRKKESRGKRSK